MNETGTTNKPQSLPPDESLVAKPGCGNTGNIPSEESKSIWLNFKDTLEARSRLDRSVELQCTNAATAFR